MASKRPERNAPSSDSAMVAYTRRDGHETETQGDNDSANTDRTTANPQDWESNAILGKFVFQPSAGHRLRLTYDHLDRVVDTDVLSAIAKPPLGNTSTIGFLANDETDRDRFAFDHAFSNGMGFIRSANWAAYYQESTTREFSFEDRNVSADRERISTFDNRVYGFQIQAESVAGTGAVQHRFIYGGDISFTNQTGLRDGTVPPAGETFPTRAFPTTDYMLAGIFIQDEITAFNGRLSIYPALRFDAYDMDPEADSYLPIVPEGQSDTHLSPKIGVLFRVSEMVNLFANYGAGFKAPSPSQVNNAFTNVIANYTSLPNPDLKPETSNTVEGGVRFGGGRWNFGVTGFAGWYDDFIEQVVLAGSFTPTDPGIFQYQNLNSVEISGFELKGEFNSESGFGAIMALSYAYGDVKEEDGVTFPLNSIQPLKLVGGVNYRDPMGRFGAQIVATYSDGKEEDRIEHSICTPPSCFAPGSFVILDATGYVNLWGDAVTLRAGVFNIFDEKYWWWGDVAGHSSISVSRDAYTSPGRNFRVSLTARI
jgi:hemoglobin/transferrin/lactoferrin receptor protein